MVTSALKTRRKIVREMFTTPGKIMILTLLAVKGEMHGYEIMKEIERISLGLWKPSHSNLYTLLNKIVEEGLLEAREEFRGRVRRVKYSLTKKGIETLAIANDMTLRILYTIVRYHEMLRKKLKKMQASVKPRRSREAAEEYLQLLKQIKEILEEKIEQLERELGEQEHSKKQKRKQETGNT